VLNCAALWQQNLGFNTRPDCRGAAGQHFHMQPVTSHQSGSRAVVQYIHQSINYA